MPFQSNCEAGVEGWDHKTRSIEQTRRRAKRRLRTIPKTSDDESLRLYNHVECHVLYMVMPLPNPGKNTHVPSLRQVSDEVGIDRTYQLHLRYIHLPPPPPRMLSTSLPSIRFRSSNCPIFGDCFPEDYKLDMQAV